MARRGGVPTITGQGQSGIHPAELRQRIRKPKIVMEDDMAKRKRIPGLKHGAKEMRNKEEQVRAGEPLLQSIKQVEEAAIKAGRRGEQQAVYVSDKPTDLEKFVKGEEQIDMSAGTWHFPKADEINLIDALLRYGVHHHFEQSITPPRIKLLSAQRFMLDWSASEFFGSVVMEWGRQALMQHEMARAPFELCWIEWNSRAYITKVESMKNEMEEDLKVGYLYDHGLISIASMTSDPRTASFLPYQMRINTPMSADEEAANAEFFRMDVPYYRALMLGNMGIEGNPTPVDREWIMSPEVTAMMRAHRFEVNPEFRENLRKHHIDAKSRQQLMFSSAGTFKQVIILLLLMTRPNKHVYFGEAKKPVRRVWIGNRQVPSVSYNTVTMHLEQKDALRRIGSDITGAHRKDHGVKEHWCQSRKKGKGCTHKFALSDPKHGECVHGCGAKIWWKKPHRRGDISLGTVAKTYKVTE